MILLNALQPLTFALSRLPGDLLRRLLRRTEPVVNGRFSIPELHRPVEIIRDRWGVPHIYAQTEYDLFFAQGFVHAQDRLFQMDLNRRIGCGRLSELIGPPGIKSDRIARVLGWPRVIKAQLDGGDAGAYAVAEAYTAGVNAFIGRKRYPLEYKLLMLKPEPWQMQDSAAWGAVLAWGLAANWENELLRAMLIDELGPEKVVDLMPDYPAGYPTILPDAHLNARLAQALHDALHEALDDVPLTRLPIGQGVGSNNWVVDGSRTAAGRPFLANDPHLPPVFPTIWYENHLVGDGINVTGFSTPGVPGVLIGHNEKVAWGITNAFPDVQDLFVERFHADDPTLYEFEGSWRKARTVIEPIFVRGRREPILETVRYTHHGPVISDILPDEKRPLAMQWASFTDNNHLRAVLNMNRAADWTGFREGVGQWGFLPSQNVVYADTEGNIGYIMPGMVPTRNRGDGLVPVPGWTGTHEWNGWIQLDDLPQQLNPKDGMIVTANNRVVENDYPHLLTGEWLLPYRANRIRELLDAEDKLTLSDQMRVQTDTVSPMAQRFLGVALAHVHKRGPLDDELNRVMLLLRNWNFDMQGEAVAPSLYYGWMIHFTYAVMAQAVGNRLAACLLGPGLVENFSGNPFHKIAPELAMRWLEQRSPDWVGEIRPLLLPALQKTIAQLKESSGFDINKWQWGRLHYGNLSSPMARIPGIGRFWKPQSLPMSGDGSTISQTESPPGFPPQPVNMIPSCRLILDVGMWDNSVSSLPGGQSAHIGSPHYQDGIEAWKNGRYHPMLFTPERINKVAAHRLYLLPPK